MWIPSRFESLSIALLEGMALGVPGIVNGNCEVLKGHCDKSHGAISYKTWEEFSVVLENIQNGSEENYQKLKNQAIQYINNNYQWDIIEKKLVKMIRR